MKKKIGRIVLRIGLILAAGLSLWSCGPKEPTPVTERPAEPESYEQPALPPVLPDQVGTIRFEQISLEEGLSQGTVFTILQDTYGFMWFGTEDGLNKYDGYNFTIYKHDPDRPGSISDSLVSVLYEDRQGVLWAGTRQGLNRLDRETGTFFSYQPDPDDANSLGCPWVVALCEDHTGALWIGTDGGGLDRLDQDRATFTHYRHRSNDPASLSSDNVRVIYEDGEGTLWIGTQGGLNRFDRTNETFTHYQHDPDDPASLSNDLVSAIVEDSQGQLWVGTEGGGLNRFDRASGTFTRYQHDPDGPYSLSHERVRAILEDRSGRLWIGTQNGLDLFNRDQNRFIHYRSSPGDPASLSSNAIWSIYEDRTGVLWFGTYGGGLNKYNRAADQFTLYQHDPDRPNTLSDNMVWSIYEDQDDQLWIGTFNGGLNKLDRESGQFTIYRHDPDDLSSLSSDDVRAIEGGEADGALWVGTSAGLDRFDPRRETFRHYRHNPTDPNSLSEDRVTALLQDHRGTLWVGTRRAGLNRLDRASGTFIRYQHDPDDAATLIDDRVWSLYEDSGGNLWVGTLGGVSLWHPDTGQFTHYRHDEQDRQSLSNDAVFSFYEDDAGTIWMGTWGGGLDRLDPDTETFTHYTEKDGLPNNVIYGIEADDEGNLWLSTNRGLSKFDPRTETFQNYDVQDGLQNNEFNVGAHFKSDEGEIFFGGIEGFNAFYPDRVRGNPYPPPIVITSFSKFNEVVRTDLLSGEQIELSYQDSLIAFEYAALDYTAPEKNQYAYMLEGQDPDWVYAGTRRHVNYTNLRGGTYTFHVKGSNSDGVWNEIGVTVGLTVTPPFWNTWWFRGLAVTLLLGLIVGGTWLRVKGVQARSRELERQVQERTAELTRHTNELEALYRADEQLYSHLDLQEVLQSLVDVAVDILGVDKSSLMIWDEQRRRLLLGAARGFSPETRAQMTFAPGEGIVGRVAEAGEAIIVEDTAADPRVAQRITEPEGIRALVHVPIKIGEPIFGVFNMNYTEPRTFDEEDQRLFTALAQRAALAIENAQLYGQAQKLAIIDERQRLARDLHDAVTQTLFSASLIAEVLPRIWERDREEGERRLEEVRQLTRGALAEMRTLLLELRPTALVEANLGDLLRQLAEATTGRARVPVSVEMEGHCLLPPEVKVALYRIAQEALNNVAKHAEAGRVIVSLHCDPDAVRVKIRDDGRGFDIANVPPDHLGIGIMRERAEDIQARLQIESEIGGGTEITVVWERPPGGRPDAP